MSKRTAEANKAIAEAWEREKQLVLAGKGTRDWTPRQQKDILIKGKAYDENGKAFEGHHMKSVEKYPEYQGKADNIEFLTKKEQLNAHNGNFKNPTNGYYDPRTGQTRDFGEGQYEPCKIIDLSMPIAMNKENSIIKQETDIYETSVDPQKHVVARLNSMEHRYASAETKMNSNFESTYEALNEVVNEQSDGETEGE